MEKLLNNSRPSGFTLVELLVYIAVSTIALLVFVTFMVDVSRSAARARVAQEVHQNAQFVMARLNREVRSASKIDLSSNTGTLVLSTAGGPTFTLDNNAVTLNGEPLTSSNVKVTTLQFSYATSAVTVQLHVVENTSVASPQSIDLQTTLVPRQSVY